MTAAMMEIAQDTGERIQNHTANANHVASIIQAPPSLESCATAGMIITIGMALAPPRKWITKSLTRDQIRRSAVSAPRPRPLLHMAADLLDVIETRGTKYITTHLQHQAEICREQMDESSAALERLNPLRDHHSAYYTSDAAAALMAHLAVPENLDWSNPATLTGYTMADYACGHGALLTAAYERARELHSRAGGEPGRLHSHMMEECITATDISPTAVAMTVENLARFQPDQPVRRTRIARLPSGPAHEDGPPRSGALDLLAHHRLPPRSIPLPQNAYGPNSQKLVLVNPPFGKPTRDSCTLTLEIPETLATAKKATPAHIMAALALRNAAPGGHVGMILPLSAVSGTASETADTKGPLGWSFLRGQLMDQCADVTIISTAHYSDTGNAFSHDTEIAEAMVVARKLRRGEPAPRTVTFVNIAAIPADTTEAAALAARINAVRRQMKPGDILPIPPGKGPAGHLHCRPVPPGGNWHGARILDPDTLVVAEALSQGRTRCGPDIPMTPLGQLAKLSKSESPHHLYGTPPSTGAPETRHQMLRGHDCTKDVRMTGRDPAPLGEPLPNAGIRHTPSPLLVSDTIRWNSQPTLACLMAQPTVAGKGWAAAVTRRPEHQKALALWLNSTMGMISYWLRANSTQHGRSHTPKASLEQVPVPDLRQLRTAQLQRLAEAYDAMAHLTLQPASEAWRDPVRQQLDRTVLEILTDGEGSAGPSLHAARAKWCLEPTVQGRKGLAAAYMHVMATLRDEAEAAERATARPTETIAKLKIPARNIAAAPLPSRLRDPKPRHPEIRNP